MRLFPTILLAALLTAAFVLACRLTGLPEMGAATRGDDALEDLLGGSRVFAGGLCMSRADLYLHRGLAHIDATAFSNRWYQRLGAEISPNIVQHREGPEGMKIVLPWVILAARASPTNTDYVLTQTYLFRATGDPQRALRDISRAIMAQPGNPEFRLEAARIRLALNQWKGSADAFDACIRMIGPRPADDDQLRTLAEACMWRGLLLERSGESNTASALLASAIRMEPKLYGALTNRVAALQAGRAPQPPVVELLAQYQKAAANPICAHDHHDHAHGDHDDDDDGD